MLGKKKKKKKAADYRKHSHVSIEKVVYITPRRGDTLEAALQRYISETDAMIACKMAELCPTLSFVYMRVGTSAKVLGFTLYRMRQEWPGSVGVYAVFPTGNDDECVVMIDKLCLRTVRRLFLIESVHVMPLYPMLLYDATHIPVKKYVVMTRGTASGVNAEIVRCPAADMTSYCWSVYSMAYNVATITLPNYRKEASRTAKSSSKMARVPLPREAGFGMMSRLAEIIAMWGGTADIHKAVAASHEKHTDTLYTCLGAFVCQSCDANNHLPTHVISRVAYRSLQTMFLGEDDMTHRLAERHLELVRSLEAMAARETEWTYGTGSYTDMYVEITSGTRKNRARDETGVLPVFYYYKFLLDTSVRLSREGRLKILRGICLVHSVKAPAAAPNPENCQKPGISRFKESQRKRLADYVQFKQDLLWRKLDKNHPCYVDMAPNPALASATRTYPLYAFLRVAMQAATLTSVKSGVDLTGGCNVDPAKLTGRSVGPVDFPVSVDIPACRKLFRRDILHEPPLEKVVDVLMYGEDFIGVYVYSPSRYIMPPQTSDTEYPEWYLAELNAGHCGVYYEACRQVFLGVMKTSAQQVYGGAEQPFEIDQRLLKRPTMLLMSNASPMATRAPVPPIIEEEEEEEAPREVARKLPGAVAKQILDWAEEDDMTRGDDDAFFEALIQKHQPRQYQKMKGIFN